MEEGRNQYSPSHNSDEGNRARTDEQLAKMQFSHSGVVQKWCKRTFNSGANGFITSIYNQIKGLLVAFPQLTALVL